MGDALNQAFALARSLEGRGKALCLALSVVAQVAALVLWLSYVEAGRAIPGFSWLVGGLVAKWALLTHVLSVLRAPQQMDRAILLTTGFISLSAALLWVLWLVFVPHLGITLATVALAVTLHLKRGAEMAAITDGGFFENLRHRGNVMASVLEALGAGVWFTLTTAGRPVLGGIALLVCMSIGHLLQFKAAGLLSSESA